MRYVIVGAALSGNKGAAAMLESTVQHLSELDPEAHFDVLTVYPRTDEKQNTNSDISILDASPLRLGVVINGASLAYQLLPGLRARIGQSVPEVGAIAGADAVLDEGGITFVDGRGKFLIYNVATILPALILRTPVVKVAQAMGPFHGRLNRTVSRTLLPHVKVIVARGSKTLQYLHELGLTNILRGADIAFTLDIGGAARRSAETMVGAGYFANRRVVGFCPSAVLNKSARGLGRDYVLESAHIIDHITDDLGLPVLLLAHSARTGTEKTHNNDLPLCREIYNRISSPDKVLFVDKEIGPQELRCLIAQCHILIAARFHAMVSALSSGVPTVVIGWSHKYGEVLDDFGLNELAASLADAREEVVYSLIDAVLSDHDALAKRVAAAYSQVRSLAMSQFDVILEVARAGRAALPQSLSSERFD